MSVTQPVPCNGCTLCCRGDAVRILPHEDASRWQTVAHQGMPGARMLAHKANGDCIYLGKRADGLEGCTIHGSAPQMCGEMDCRTLQQRIPFAQAQMLHKRGAFPLRVWRRGQELNKGKP